MNKYKSKIPRDDLKRFAKEIAKKLVNSDFKSGRVHDPTKIDEKHQQKVKKFCKDFFDKAAHKHKKHEDERAIRKGRAEEKQKSSAGQPGDQTKARVYASPKTTPVNSRGGDASPDIHIKGHEEDELSDAEDVKMSEDEEEEGDADTGSFPNLSRPSTNGESLKRKRSDFDGDDEEALHLRDDVDLDDEDHLITKSPFKKVNRDESDSDRVPTAPPPPPPPPPPTDSPPREDEDVDRVSEEVADTQIKIEAAEDDDLLHKDTNFRAKSMRDVLAEAQQDDEMDMDEDEPAKDQEETKNETTSNTGHVKFENGIKVELEVGVVNGAGLGNGPGLKREVVLKEEVKEAS